MEVEEFSLRTLVQNNVLAFSMPLSDDDDDGSDDYNAIFV